MSLGMLWKSINQDNNVTQSWFISTEGFLQLNSRGKCSLSMSIWYENIPFNLKTDSLISWSCMAYHRFTLLHHILMLHWNINSKLISDVVIFYKMYLFFYKRFIIQCIYCGFELQSSYYKGNKRMYLFLT